jgi:hypothetical protein
MIKTMFRYIIFLLFAFTSCNGKSQLVVTPVEFINTMAVSDSVYKKDSAAILEVLYSNLQKHEFYNKEYFDSTKLIIDKIFYDSTQNKIAVFVLVENPMSRRKYPDLNYKVYYSSYCYLGKRTEADSFELKWFNTFYPINFNNKQEISSAIEKMYFTELAVIVDGNDQPVYKYNLNDKRFWTGPGWKKFFE